MRQPNADSSADGDTDCNGDIYTYSYGHSYLYADPDGTGNCNTDRNTFGNANLRASRHTRRVEHGQPLSHAGVWSGCG